MEEQKERKTENHEVFKNISLLHPELVHNQSSFERVSFFYQELFFSFFLKIEKNKKFIEFEFEKRV
jgi:hypothetical protein